MFAQSNFIHSVIPVNIPRSFSLQMTKNVTVTYNKFYSISTEIFGHKAHLRCRYTLPAQPEARVQLINNNIV